VGRKCLKIKNAEETSEEITTGKAERGRKKEDEH